MKGSVERPRRGLQPTEALARWSDPASYNELIELSGHSPPPSLIEIGGGSGPVPEPEYQLKWSEVETAFFEKLKDGDLLGSAIQSGDDRREIIHPSLWDIIEIDFENNWIGSYGRRFENPEFFERSLIPLNIRSLPSWLEAEFAAAGLSEFRHDPSYRHVWLNGIEFRLGDIQANVVRILHRAVLADDPWQPGARVLEEAGSAQIKMVDAFKRKDWKQLIESDGRGRYRLRVDQFGKALQN